VQESIESLLVSRAVVKSLNQIFGIVCRLLGGGIGVRELSDDCVEVTSLVGQKAPIPKPELQNTYRQP